MLNGIDISGWQGDIDLSKLNFDFVIVKATEGTGYVNPYCDKKVQQAIKLGKKWGFYHSHRGVMQLRKQTVSWIIALTISIMAFLCWILKQTL